MRQILDPVKVEQLIHFIFRPAAILLQIHTISIKSCYGSECTYIQLSRYGIEPILYLLINKLRRLIAKPSLAEAIGYQVAHPALNYFLCGGHQAISFGSFA